MSRSAQRLATADCQCGEGVNGDGEECLLAWQVWILCHHHYYTLYVPSIASAEPEIAAASLLAGRPASKSSPQEVRGERGSSSAGKKKDQVHGLLGTPAPGPGPLGKVNCHNT